MLHAILNILKALKKDAKAGEPGHIYLIGIDGTPLALEKIRSGDFSDEVDVLLFPDISPSIISQGEPARGSRYRRRWSPLPPEYSGGIDTVPTNGGEAGKGKDPQQIKGSDRIKKWVEGGGTVVALDGSSEFIIDLFELPVTDVLDDVPRSAFNCPGSSLRVEMNMESPLSFGMREEEVIYFANSPAFRTRVPDPRFGREVIARYPDDETDILVSGYLEGGDLLEKRAAMVEFSIGDGKVILIGFRPQHRAQPVRTFKLLFNTLYSLEAITE
jgi:hypothetical protein